MCVYGNYEMDDLNKTENPFSIQRNCFTNREQNIISVNILIKDAQYTY